MSGTILGQLHGGPLDTQTIPLEAESLAEIEDELVLPWEAGQLVYRRSGEPEHTGEHDGPTTVPYRYDAESSSNPIPED